MDIIEHIRHQLDLEIKRSGSGKNKILESIGTNTKTVNQAFARKSVRLSTILEICKRIDIDFISLLPGYDPEKKSHNDRYVKLLEDRVDQLEEKIESMSNEGQSKAG